MQTQDICRYLWLTIAVANYLTAVKRKKVAVVELSGGKELNEIACNFNQNIGDGECFELFGVRYYPYYKEKLLTKLLREKYDYIIFDGLKLFGNRNVDLSDYQCKLIVGSFKIWETAEYKTCLDRLWEEGAIKDYVFLAEYFEHKEIRHIEKEKSISFVKLPAELNPFRIKRTEFCFFESFL